MNKDQILKKLESEDLSDEIKEPAKEKGKNSKNESISNIIEKINSTWDNFISGFFAFAKKLIKRKKKKSLKEYESSESNKHEKLFGLLIKYMSLLIAIAFVIVLIVAFFKVFIFSEEITQHHERVEQKKEITGVDFDIDSAYSWETKISQDVKNNERNINEIKTNINEQKILIRTNYKSIEEMIKKSNADIGSTINNNLQGLKRELYGYVDQTKFEITKALENKIKNIKPTAYSKDNISDSIMGIPDKVVKITEDIKKQYIDGVETNETTNASESTAGKNEKSVKEKEVAKKIEENDKEIYMSINIETVDSDDSGYDEHNKSAGDVNNTLPPYILRQGMSNGVLVTGISAPTFEMDKNPAAVFLTFKGKSIISNMFEQDVENCTATGSVFGNIITRRAEVLVNKISCTFKKDNKQYMVRANVKGWVYDGYDGRLGIPGILVDNSGAILNDSMIIGMLQGFGKFVSSSAQIYAQQGAANFNTTGVPTYSPTQVAQTNLAAGVGEQLASGFDTITEYYQKIIDTLYPYIDVKGGRKISIFFDGGETLTPVEYTPFLVNDMENENDNNDNDMEIEVDANDW